MLPNPRHLILNLLLGAGGRALSASDAVASCALFGVSENSSRVALARLAAAGLVQTAGRGAYRLGPQAAGLATDVARWRDAESSVCDWTGGWIAVHVAGLGRSQRAQVRVRERALGLLGLVEFAPGLYLRPDNLAGGVAAVRTRLAALGLDAAAPVFVARDLDAAGDLRARALWDGPSLNRRYHDAVQRLERWLAGADALTPDLAARDSFQLGNDAIRALVFDPLLPAPLVDVAARRRFVDTLRRFDSAGQAIWQRFFATLPARTAPTPPARLPGLPLETRP